MRRALVVMVLVLFAADARADVAPWPIKVPRPEPKPPPAPPQPPIDPATGLPAWEFKEEKKPKRTGPFRSCGSGAGVGLAGIGAAWAALWLGMRFVRAKKSA